MKALKVLIAIAAIGAAAYVVIHFQQRRQLAELNNRATVHLDRQEYAQARDLLEQASRRDSGNYVIWKNLGIACDELKDLPKAIEAYEKSLSLNPNQPEVRDNVAILKKALTFRDQPPAKEADLFEGPGEARKLANTALARERMGDTAQAIDLYKNSLALDPNQADVRKRLDALQKKTGPTTAR